MRRCGRTRAAYDEVLRSNQCEGEDRRRRTHNRRNEQDLIEGRGEAPLNNETELTTLRRRNERKKSTDRPSLETIDDRPRRYVETMARHSRCNRTLKPVGKDRPKQGNAGRNADLSEGRINS